MARILHVQASPRGEESFSGRVAGALLAELRSHLPDCTVDALDLFRTELPEFSAPAAKAKYAVLAGAEPTDEAGRAWAEVVAVVERFRAADALVLSTGMWNFSIPYRLKHYIDLLVQPGLTFTFSPESGYDGLVGGRPVVVIASRGSAYTAGTGMADYDFQLPYLRAVLGFIGLTDIEEVVVEPTLAGGSEAGEHALQRAGEHARTVARGLAGRLL